MIRYALGKCYDHTIKFFELMEKYENENTMWSEVVDTDEYSTFEDERQYLMETHPVLMVSTAIFMTLRHWSRMKKAQTYYGNGFGKPCKRKI